MKTLILLSLTLSSLPAFAEPEDDLLQDASAADMYVLKSCDAQAGMPEVQKADGRQSMVQDSSEALHRMLDRERMPERYCRNHRGNVDAHANSVNSVRRYFEAAVNKLSAPADRGCANEISSLNDRNQRDLKVIRSKLEQLCSRFG
jgi:hypothetical protein